MQVHRDRCGKEPKATYGGLRLNFEINLSSIALFNIKICCTTCLAAGENGNIGRKVSYVIVSCVSSHCFNIL